MRMARFSRLRLVLVAALACSSASPASAQSQPASSHIQFNTAFEFDPAKRKPVPFELQHNIVLFKAQVEGREVWAVLDNGADRTVIDSSFANASGLHVGPPVDRMRLVTGAVAQSGRVANVHIIMAGQGTIAATLASADLSSLSKVMGRPIALILGKEVLQSFALVVLPSKKTFEFWPSSTLALPPEAPHLVIPTNAAPIILDNGIPQVRVSLGGKPALLSVDLGNSDTISLGQSAWRRLGLDRFATIPRTVAGGDGRPVPARTTIVGTLTVGLVTGYNASVTDGPDGLNSDDGRLGMGFFAHYDFAIDVPARRIWLLANGDTGGPLELPKDMLAIESDREIAADAVRASALYRSGQRQEAEKLFAALRPMARSEIGANGLCWGEATAGVALDSAVQFCRDAVTQSNRNPGIVDSLGMALLQSGKLDEALAAYNEAIDKGHRAESYMGRAIVHARKGEAALAQADLAEAKQRNPGIEAEFAGYGLKLEILRAGGAAK
jgi:predicted aspartyl protease